MKIEEELKIDIRNLTYNIILLMVFSIFSLFVDKLLAVVFVCVGCIINIIYFFIMFNDYRVLRC